MKRVKLENKISLFLSVFITLIAALCISFRATSANSTNSVTLAAACLIFPQGGAGVQADFQNISETDNTANQSTQASVEAAAATTPTLQLSTQPATADPNATTYPIVETLFGGSGTMYNNFYVRNSTDFNLDISSQLSSPLGFAIQNTNKPQVLIVHTHTTEAYMDDDLGFYYAGKQFRSSDDNENITRVGAAISNTLTAQGITAVQATTHHDDPTYNGSYDRSAATINKYLEQYPTIKVILDIHRDSVGYDDERGKLKPTFTYNNKKAAQIMIMAGYDPNGEYDFPDWEYNLRFALQLQQQTETMYPGMTRPVDFGDFAYNMNINTGSLLIEIGTDVNTFAEAEYSGELLANSLAAVLKNNME